jgi:hypothetical protein
MRMITDQDLWSPNKMDQAPAPLPGRESIPQPKVPERQPAKPIIVADGPEYEGLNALWEQKVKEPAQPRPVENPRKINFVENPRGAGRVVAGGYEYKPVYGRENYEGNGIDPRWRQFQLAKCHAQRYGQDMIPEIWHQQRRHPLYGRYGRYYRMGIR